MSSKSVHRASGCCLALLLGALYYNRTGMESAIAIGVGALTGSSLPDQMEIAWYVGGSKKSGWFGRREEGVRHSLIPHRTITHWLLLWCCLTVAAVAYLAMQKTMAALFLAGLTLSGLLHVCLDARTPMGVPWMHPYKRTPARLKES